MFKGARFFFFYERDRFATCGKYGFIRPPNDIVGIEFLKDYKTNKKKKRVEEYNTTHEYIELSIRVHTHTIIGYSHNI